MECGKWNVECGKCSATCNTCWKVGRSCAEEDFVPASRTNLNKIHPSALLSTMYVMFTYCTSSN